jgi:hypothetical protein
MGEPALVFLIPTPELGRTEDVQPEKLSAKDNAWIEHTREILLKKQRAAKAGAKPGGGGYIGEDNARVKPATADACPAMAELSSIGWLIKWPATAILRRITPKGWLLKPSTNYNFYGYNPLTSFPEQGEAEAISVETGWTVVTPPGWSVLIKNVPNNLAGAPAGLILAEGIVRSDVATIPLQTHAFIAPGAPPEITLKRGAPMAVLMPFRREAVEIAVVEELAVIDETAKAASRAKEAFASAPGRYRAMYVDDASVEPNGVYGRLRDAWLAKHREGR